jgi:hypothetical protein
MAGRRRRRGRSSAIAIKSSANPSELKTPEKRALPGIQWVCG